MLMKLVNIRVNFPKEKYNATPMREAGFTNINTINRLESSRLSLLIAVLCLSGAIAHSSELGMTPLTHPPSEEFGLLFWVAVAMATHSLTALDAVRCSAGWLLLDSSVDPGVSA
jgi:hypothetical protein